MSKKNESGVVKSDDENFVGADPIYKNSAYVHTAPMTPDGDDIEDDAEREAIEVQLDAIDRVKQHEEDVVVPTPDKKSFADFVAEREAARHPEPEPEPVAEPEPSTGDTGTGGTGDTGGGSTPT